MINKNKQYHFVFVSISFKYNLAFCEQLKKNFSVEIPFLEFGNVSNEMRGILDSYLYIEESLEFETILKGIISKYHQVTFTHLGVVSGLEICEFLDTCESNVLEAIKEGYFYRLTQGRFQNLIVRAEGVENNVFVGSYSVLNEKREIRVPVGEVEFVNRYPYLKPKNYFSNYIKKAELMGDKKAIILDGDNVLYRNIFGYNKIYTTRTRKFVGGAFGFYFTLLKLKELFVEYEVHVVFDGYPKKKFEQNPNYKANRVKKSENFMQAYKSNRLWVMQFIEAIGFHLYLIKDQEADDVIGSLAIYFTEQLDYKNVLIHSTDNDFYQLVNDKVQIYQPKVSFRGHSKIIKVEDVLEKYPVGDIKKINWYRAIKGDSSDNIPSINTFLLEQKFHRVRNKKYISLIEKADNIDQLRELMSKDERLNKFVEDGQFQRNLELLTINGNISLTPIEQFQKEFNDERCQQLLEENCFFKELEMFQRNRRIFQSLW